jgi:hypothetical protein
MPILHDGMLENVIDIFKYADHVKQNLKIGMYSDTSANEDNQFRNHIL